MHPACTWNLADAGRRQFRHLALDNAPAEAIAGDAHRRTRRAVMATTAYLLGLMDRAFAITLEYLKTREQFGRKIGSFQALQHRAADMKMQVSLTRAVVKTAAMAMDSGSLEARQAAVSRAKTRASDAAMMVTRACIQLHGGVGYTDAYDIGLFLRKTMVLAPILRFAALHRARFRALSPEPDED